MKIITAKISNTSNNFVFPTKVRLNVLEDTFDKLLLAQKICVEYGLKLIEIEADGTCLDDDNEVYRFSEGQSYKIYPDGSVFYSAFDNANDTIESESLQIKAFKI